jgi:hypothetical protein
MDEVYNTLGSITSPHPIYATLLYSKMFETLDPSEQITLRVWMYGERPMYECNCYLRITPLNLSSNVIEISCFLSSNTIDLREFSFLLCQRALKNNPIK